MYEKFGEMNSAGELNELAGNLLKEGDTDSIKELAKENGIDDDIAQMFINGEIDMFCDDMTAAIGKLQVEADEFKPAELMIDWIEYIRGLCLSDNDIAKNIRKKGKSLKGCISGLVKYSFSNRIPLDDEIKKAAGINASRVEFGVPGMGTAKRLIREYYS